MTGWANQNYPTADLHDLVARLLVDFALLGIVAWQLKHGTARL